MARKKIEPVQRALPRRYAEKRDIDRTPGMDVLFPPFSSWAQEANEREEISTVKRRLRTAGVELVEVR